MPEDKVLPLFIILMCSFVFIKHFVLKRVKNKRIVLPVNIVLWILTLASISYVVWVKYPGGN